MSITPEERAEWRKMAEYRAGSSLNPSHRQVLRLLDALEAAEAQRDVLIEIIAVQDCPYGEGKCDKKIEAENTEDTMCRKCWQEWLEKNYGKE